MKTLRELDYSNTPGVKSALKQLIKALIRKCYVQPITRYERYMVYRRFTKTKRMIGRHYLKKQTAIPKIIHYVWVGGNDKPASVKQYIASWRKHCPDYLIVEWNEKNYDITVNRYAREAYQSKKWAFVTDYMRLDLLDKFGGIYVDSDVEIIKNLDEFLNEQAFTSFETGDSEQTLMTTGMMAATAGNAWIRYLKTYYGNDRSFILADGSFDLNANTVTITRMTRDRYGIKIDNTLQRTNDFVIYPNDYFCPKSWGTGKITLTKNSHTIHHFAGSWKKVE